MGLQCKPVGKFGGLLAKVDRANKKADAAAKRAGSKDAAKDGKKNKNGKGSEEN